MSMPIINAVEARRLIESGALLVDVRESDEQARERIEGAQLAPLSRLEQTKIEAGGRAVLFHCKSGMRTQGAAGRLAAAAGEGCEAYIVEGGLDALRKAGAPVLRDLRQPIEMQRQVQIGAGALVLTGTLLGLFVAPGFFAVPAFVGAGLIFAGATGFCGMARLLAYAPWNAALRTPARPTA